MQAQTHRADRHPPAARFAAPAETAALPATSSAALPARFAGGVVAIGNFDGVHLGHRRLIGQAASIAAATGSPLGVLTFEPHPRVLFSAGARHFRIASSGRKRDLLAAAGVDFAVVEPFTPDLASRSPEDFAREYLVRRLGVRHVVVGDDYRFGRGRAGDAGLLRLLGARLGFDVTAFGKLAAEGACVSSTRIRDLLHAGDVGAARRLLGRSWDVRGRLLPRSGRAGSDGAPVRLDDADYVRLPPGSYEVSVRGVDGDSGLRGPAVAEVQAAAAASEFTIALRGAPVRALSARGARIEIAFRRPKTMQARRRLPAPLANRPAAEGSIVHGL